MSHLTPYPAATRNRARQLRQQGLTYTEICAQVGRIPKGTLAYWCKDIRLSFSHQARIQRKIVESGALGRPLALEAWARKVRAWQDIIQARALPIAQVLDSNALVGKLVCGVMYLCEGGKYPSTQQVMFGNTDPAMVRAFLSLLRECYQIDEHRLRIRVMCRWDQDAKQLKQYWSALTGVPLDQFYPTYADKRTRGKPTQKTNYRGVCCIQYSDTTLQYELQAIGETVLKLINGGADGDRTRGLVNAIDALSQLSYCPTMGMKNGRRQ